MDLSTAVSIGVAVVALPAFVAVATRDLSRPRWWAPLLLSGALAAWSAYAMVADGVFDFLPEHAGTAWETQIWIDLLLLGGVAWFLLVPRLRAVGIKPLPWLPLVLATGSIGLLVLLARLLRAEAAARAVPAGR